MLLGDKVIKAHLWKSTPYVKRRSMKLMKISDKAVCLMIMVIFKSYLKSHQNKNQGFSEVLKSKVIWQGTKNFRVVKEGKYESLSNMCRVISVCKGIGLTLNVTNANHTRFSIL